MRLATGHGILRSIARAALQGPIMDRLPHDDPSVMICWVAAADQSTAAVAVEPPTAVAA